MLTSLELVYTVFEKNENMQGRKREKKRRVRAEEMPIANKTMNELGAIGFNDIRRFKIRFIKDIKEASVNYINYKNKTYKVKSIKDDGSGRFITIDVEAND